jgi:predicted enzyme related to lactoylglutathione lyase
MPVPEVLLSGHHEQIERWRRDQSIGRTARRRPDMLRDADLTSEERRSLEESVGAGATSTHLFRVIMPAEGIERAVAFYAKVLGAAGERVSPERHYFRCGGTILAVVDVPLHGGAFRPNVEHAYFAVADLKARYAIARKAGCSWIEEKIARRPWGEKSFYARDPSGNPICFVDERTVFTGNPKE